MSESPRPGRGTRRRRHAGPPIQQDSDMGKRPHLGGRQVLEVAGGLRPGTTLQTRHRLTLDARTPLSPTTDPNPFNR